MRRLFTRQRRSLPPNSVQEVAAGEIRRLLRRHRARWWWPWRCRCGATHPCGARLAALDEQLRAAARAAVDWYPTYFARQRRPEGRLR